MTENLQPEKAGRVLVVDDDPMMREMMRRALGAEHTVDCAESAEVAERLLRGDHPPEVILCDQMMPGESGLEFLLRLQRSGHPSVRILVTGQGDMELAVRAVNEHAVFLFLTKPVGVAMLRQAVRDALREARAADAPPAPTVPEAPRPLRTALGLGGAVAAAILMVLGVTLAGGVLVLTLMYVLKTLLGLDFFPDFHLGDWI